uniref:Sulfotransfer_1 domain-containing protein n=1 Tax=Parastrongyloides trichosuri TaxID=131310 RepID=A0A0N4Z603_PARTI
MTVSRFKDHDKPQLVQTLRNINPRQYWSMYAVSIHPIERFLDNFFKYCPRDSLMGNHSKIICYGCWDDMGCLIDKLYDQFWKVIKKKDKLTIGDYIFAPYSWRCNFKYNLKDYIKLNVSNENIFFDEIDKILKRYRIDKNRKKLIGNYINDMFDNRTGRMVSNDLRLVYDSELQRKQNVVEKFLSIYYYDYVNFNFELPKFPTSL